MNISVTDNYIIYNNTQYLTKPVLKVGVSVVLYLCARYWDNNHIPKKQWAHYFNSGGRDRNKLNINTYSAYVDDFKHNAAQWQQDFALNNYKKNSGPGDSIILHAYRLACDLNLSFLQKYSHFYRDNIAAHISLADKKEIIVKVAIDFLESRLIIDENLNEQREYRVLVLGTHDDISYLENTIRQYLEKELGHKIFTIDYDKLESDEKSIYRIENNAINQTTPLNMNEMAGEDIYEYINYHIYSTQYDLYFIVIGRHYGQPLNFQHLEISPWSRRHYELDSSNQVCKEFPSPIYILRPQPGSIFYRSLEINLDKLFTQQGFLSPEEKQQARRENNIGFHNMGPLIDNTGQLETGDVLDVTREGMLLEKMKSCIDTLATADSMQLDQPLIPTPHQDSATTVVSSSLEEHIESIYKTFTENTKTTPTPGLCAFIYGQTQKQLNAAIATLEKHNYWDTDRSIKYTFRESHFHDKIFWQSLFRKLKLDFNICLDKQQQIDELTKAIAEQKQPYKIILANGHQSGLTPKAFLEEIWQPLYQSLQRNLPKNWYKSAIPSMHILISWRTRELDKTLCNDDTAQTIKYDHFIKLRL